jgi:hypothetical protein
MNNINKKQSNKVYSNNASEDFEDISEKKTSKLGYILLILMVIFMIVVGQTIFSDLKKIPERPNHPAYCISSFNKINYLTNLNYLPNCYFSDIDKKFNLESKYNNIKSQLNSIVSFNKQIDENEREINLNERQIEQLNKQYDLSLQEKIANEQAIMDKVRIKDDITYLRAQNDSLNQKIATLTTQRDTVIKGISPQITDLNQLYNEALEYYKDKQAFYNLKVFLLKLLFILPFFILSLYFYFKLKRKDSPYTIIFTAILGASAILFLQIVLVFLYEILPKEWLKRIFKFFREIAFLRYVIYYGSVLLVIAIFGGIVYFIQKRVFDPVKVATRRLKDNKCPNCSFTLNVDHIFCPKCGQLLKDKCPNCGNLKIHYLPHCPNCGNK